MSDTNAITAPPVGRAVPGPLQGAAGFWSVVALAGGAGAVLLGVAASSAGEPLLLAVLSCLAMFGVFFLFAAAAGHLRLSQRVTESDLVKAISDNLDDALLITDVHGRPVYWNAAHAAIVGLTDTGRLHTLEHALRTEPEASEALFRLTRAAERATARFEEVRVGPVGGRTAPGWLRLGVRAFVVPGREREHGPLVLWSIADVTEEREKEAARLRSVQETLAVYDTGPVGLVAIGGDGLVRHINRTLAEWLGLAPAVLSHRSLRLADIMGVDAVELLRLTALQQPASVRRIPIDLTREDGHRLPTSIAISAHDAEGGMVLAIHNRLHEEAAEAEARGGSQAGMARAVQLAPYGVATITGEGRIMMSNPAFTRMILDSTSGHAELAVDVLCRSVDEETRAAVDLALRQVVAGRANVPPVEITVGAQRDLVRRVYFAPLAATRRGRESAILYVIDVTEQKALEARIAQGQKMEAVGNLAGGIAHDFNNVLTAIIGFSDLLLSSHRQTDPAYKDLMNIKSSANRAAGLVKKLLAYSRRQTLQFEPLHLAELVTDVSVLVPPIIGESVKLDIEPGRDLWLVKSDKNEIDQLILNLAKNARDAMPNGGTITIRTRNVSERESQRIAHKGMAVGEYVLLEIEDTGTGMTPEVMARIFEPYFTTKAVGKGTGLGLATAYGLVKQSGGFIYPESTPGKGTVFRIYLPRLYVEPEDEQPAKPVKQARHRDLTGSGRILLVEDEDIVRSFAVRALKRQGYEVLEASDGVEALEIVRRNDGHIDLVVSDVVMPEMNGPTLLRELRRTHPDLKIIFVSGYPNEAFKEGLPPGETFAFLPKPFTLPQLAAKVKEEMGR